MTDDTWTEPMAQARPLEKIESMLPADTAEKLRAAEDVAQVAGEHAKLIASNISDVASRLSRAAAASMRRDPVKALVTAGAVGFVVGVLWKS